ncbi:MAG: hypothetical protein DMG85_03545 [Acidobacteria bacterium]|nr:MAG: hypothetical protein DMG85_03545 [Acidobacteriota bacterium]
MTTFSLGLGANVRRAQPHKIALSAGFSDQSHLARHFRRMTGMSPSVVRWEQR